MTPFVAIVTAIAIVCLAAGLVSARVMARAGVIRRGDVDDLLAAILFWPIILPVVGMIMVFACLWVAAGWACHSSATTADALERFVWGDAR